jgi:hypothetical protein
MGEPWDSFFDEVRETQSDDSVGRLRPVQFHLFDAAVRFLDGHGMAGRRKAHPESLLWITDKPQFLRQATLTALNQGNAYLNSVDDLEPYAHSISPPKGTTAPRIERPTPLVPSLRHRYRYRHPNYTRDTERRAIRLLPDHKGTTQANCWFLS